MLVFGSQYAQATVVFQVLIWFFFFTMLHTVHSSGLIAVGQEKKYRNVTILSAVIYAVMIVECTALYGLIGAAVAVVSSEAITLVLVRKQLQSSTRIQLFQSFSGILVAAIVMGVAIFFLPPIHVVFSIIIGAIIYFTLLFSTRAIATSDISDPLKRV